MKKAVAVTLAGIFLISAGLFFPKAVSAHDVKHCFDEHVECRTQALAMDASTVTITLALTVCDIALARCILGFSHKEV